MTTQVPAWRGQSSAGQPAGQAPGHERATPGTVVDGRYELRSAIGNGGMGTVWRATDALLRREVAVKEVILPPTMPRSERDALCERTLREARAAAALSHPSVVQVYDVVTDAGRPWIVMELLEARSLADMVIDDGPAGGPRGGEDRHRHARARSRWPTPPACCTATSSRPTSSSATTGAAC